MSTASSSSSPSQKKTAYDQVVHLTKKLANRGSDGFIVSFRGMPGAGKTTCARRLASHFPGARIISFGEAIKCDLYDALSIGIDPLSSLFPNPPDKASLTGIRPIVTQDSAEKLSWVAKNKNVLGPWLQWLGNGRRAFTDPQYWVKRTEPEVAAVLGQGRLVIIDDARDKCEFDMVERLHGIDAWIGIEETDARENLQMRDGAPDKRDFNHPADVKNKVPGNADVILVNRGPKDRWLFTHIDDLALDIKRALGKEPDERMVSRS